MRIERKKQSVKDPQMWLGSRTGTTDAATVTIDGSALSEFTDIIPSGIPLKEVEEGKYAPVASAEDTLAGFLLTPQEVFGDDDIVAPLMWHGAIRVDRLPAAAFDVSTLAVANPRFDIRKDG